MKDIVLSLYDLTGNMARPWVEAGYTAVLVDMQHKPGIEHDGNVIRIGADIRNGWMPPRDIVDRIAFVSAFPPCDHLAVSGARWFKGKGLRKLALSVDLFATAAELCEWIGAPYMIENPVSTISSYWRKPDATFHPHHFTLLEPDDNYTKATCLWLKNLPPLTPTNIVEGRDARVHRMPPGPNRWKERSRTFEGIGAAMAAQWGGNAMEQAA